MVDNREFSVRVIKKEAMAAALPMQHHWLPQSNLDLLLPPLTFGVFFCYQKPTPKFTFGSIISGVLKAALAEALVSYYALAGEVVQNAGGEPELLCNNRGVEFAEAVADVDLSELNLYNPDESVEGKLVPGKKHAGVLAVQVTELKCGGVVVGCSFDHRVADAYSANMFPVSWSEVAQAKPLPNIPCFRRSFLFPRRPAHYDLSIDAMYTLISSLLPPAAAAEPQALQTDEQSVISRIYYIESDEIIRIQSLANSQKGSAKINHRITKLQAFSAFLWKIIAAGIMSRKDYSFKNFKLGMVVDGRTRLSDGDELLKGYFGNVLSIPFGDRKIEDLQEKPLSWVANAVREFLEEAVTREHFLGLIDWVEAHRPKPALAKIYGGGEWPAVVVSSGQQFPVRKIDFGWGKPAFGSYHFHWGGEAGYVMPMPNPKGNGDWIVYMHLQKWQVELIEAHASHVFKPVTSEYLGLI
ncbi:PREDICTED: shikimate O-hydroxycinnamoyltransferase-like [Ipomoea nil]|uniref:shikimate O-hydroxycinnamoyltransferase-like n=1 Tax=Ipomoea nil TaxID=35883 RepID=UPI000901D196|nr:PREDICTED: shikimate O-hydroxycinnamoyltransferase-like [Ipomoea nil]